MRRIAFTRIAFTLIELLVVVAIIAILMGILMPSLSGAREQSKATVCRSQLYQIAVAIQAYQVEWNGRIPRVISPMTNGTTVNPGFGNASWSDDQLNPFDRQKWPDSLPNILMPKYIGQQGKLFVCPSAKLGLPRRAKPLLYTYREAAANNLNGSVDPNINPDAFIDPVLTPGAFDYRHEHFAFLDGRMYRHAPLRLTNNFILDAEVIGIQRRTFVRDLVAPEQRPDGVHVAGPHKKGINVISNSFEVEYRDEKTTNEDLAPDFGESVRF